MGVAGGDLEWGNRANETEELFNKLPYSRVDRIKLLGMWFDRQFNFNIHMDQLWRKAKLRLAILSKVASTSWGLETGMIKATGKALVVSLLRYGLILTGSGMDERLFHRADTRIINPLARKISGAGPSARIQVLHAVAGVSSMHNLFIQHCASFLNLAIRAEGSSLQTKVREEMGKYYELWD